LIGSVVCVRFQGLEYRVFVLSEVPKFFACFLDPVSSLLAFSVECAPSNPFIFLLDLKKKYNELPPHTGPRRRAAVALFNTDGRESTGALLDFP
jgi:hypothetical protein